MIGATSRAVVMATVLLVAASSPAGANGLTFPIDAGASGPYEYQVDVGPFSPLRTAVFVAVTLMAEGSPVTDARVAIRASVDDSRTEAGPLEAVNTPIHPWTYEVSFDLPDLAREKVLFSIEVNSRHGPAVIRTDMIVPHVDDSVLTTGEPAPSEKTSATSQPASGADRDGSPSTVGPTYLGVALLAGLISIALAAWGLIRNRRRRP